MPTRTTKAGFPSSRENCSADSRWAMRRSLSSPVVWVRERILLGARMIITTYNEHVRLLSSEPVGA